MPKSKCLIVAYPVINDLYNGLLTLIEHRFKEQQYNTREKN